MSNELQTPHSTNISPTNVSAPDDTLVPPQRLSPPDGGADDDQPQPVKRKRGRFWKALGVLLLVGASAAYGYFNHTKSGIEQRDLFIEIAPVLYEAHQNPNKIFDEVGTDHFNILLVGRDVNWKIGKVYDPNTKTYRPYQVVDKDSPARSDTMIVMSLDKSNGSIRMISLPRDARVHLPPNKYHERLAKLNAAHAFGGVDLLKQTLHDELGLTIHRYAVIKFEGFKKLIDEVGGVYVDVIGPVTRDGKRKDLIYDDDWGNLHIHLKPGKQWLNGQQAHDYVRFRMDLEGDASRIRRQQSVMRALARALKDMPMSRVPSVVKQIRQQFETDMSDSDLAAAGLFAKNGSQQTKIQPVTMFGVYSTRGSLTLNRPKNELLMRAIFGSTFDAKHFLENSPSTDEDEIGLENNSSPEALELLREAGIIKGAPQPDRLAAGDSSGSNDTIQDATSEAMANTAIETPSTSTESATSGLNVESESSTPREESPAPRRVRRRKRDATESSAAPSKDSSPAERPRRRRRVRRETSPQTSENRPAAHDLSVESPIPQPEAESSQATSSEESPIPRPE